MVCEAMICDRVCTCTVQTANYRSSFSISSDSYYSYVPCFKRENQQEPASWHNCRLGTVDNTRQLRYDRQLQNQQEQREQWVVTPCRNQKRKLCATDHEQPVQLKRLREETVTTFVPPMIQEMDWQYDSNALNIDPNTINCNLEQSSSTSTGCNWGAAGNSSLISKQDHNHSDDSDSDGNNTEYEKLLFITHGCSAYHYQLAQLCDNHTVTEF